MNTFFKLIVLMLTLSVLVKAEGMLIIADSENVEQANHIKIMKKYEGKIVTILEKELIDYPFIIDSLDHYKQENTEVLVLANLINPYKQDYIDFRISPNPIITGRPARIWYQLKDPSLANIVFHFKVYDLSETVVYDFGANLLYTGDEEMNVLIFDDWNSLPKGIYHLKVYRKGELIGGGEFAK